ncbi:TPA: holin [Salmonella enterica]|nr:holin [Salmonella enterica]
MREFISLATYSSGGASFSGAVTGQLLLAVLSFIFFIIFGAVGLWLRWRDSKAIREALENTDLKAAVKINQK